jgi:YVTN family beta-propeller protein
LTRQPLRVLRTIGGFDQPHIAAISPDGRYAYVTDDAAGSLTVIRLDNLHVTSRISVGRGAHHLAFSPDERRAWVALGESAARLTLLDTSTLERPRVVGHFAPGFAVHDLSFSSDGQAIWLTSASTPEASVFSARGHRLLTRIPVGPPPQHLLFAGRYAYLTSGYGGRIEQVDARTGRILRRTTAPYGSFELAAGYGYVATSSLLRGTLAIYTPALQLRKVVALAPATREVSIILP